ncbi:hypothetical protein Hanom_Chr13g01212681 [Helianthus anomalus]
MYIGPRKKYKTTLTTDAPIHVDTLRQFWANADVQSYNKKYFGIMSKVEGIIVQISPSSISTVFALDDQACKTSFEKQEIHTEFIERGYEGQLTGVTIFKPKFPAEMKFFSHTLPICLSVKTTSFNEIPQKVQYLRCAILTKNLLHYIPGIVLGLGGKCEYC